MSTKKANIQNDEINLLEIILYLWKQKFLILSFSLTFLIAGFIYGTLQPKIYKTNVTLHNVPKTLFFKYNLYLQGDLEKIFDNDLRLNLLSFDNLMEFVEKNNNINKLKSTLKEKNIDIRKYFKEKFNLEKNKYTLRFEKNFQGEDFLNDYVIFTKQKTETIFKEQLISTIDSKINYYKQNLKIAEKIDLQNPILKTMNLETNNGYVIFAIGKDEIIFNEKLMNMNADLEEIELKKLILNSTIRDLSLASLAKEPNTLFYAGTKILSQKLIYLNELKNEASNLTLNYNLFIEKASPAYQISKSTLVYAVAGFIVGLFTSLIIIFIRV
jgi:LPS O-antigen subunit length determinant protein (WzzB/FepE family)